MVPRNRDAVVGSDRAGRGTGFLSLVLALAFIIFLFVLFGLEAIDGGDGATNAANQASGQAGNQVDGR